jgi:hypothetical protein
LKGREWVEQREREARTKEEAAWAGKALRVGEGEGKPGRVMGVIVVIGEEGQGIWWTQRRRVGVWGRGSRGVGCFSEKDLGRGTLEAQRGA